MSLPSCLLTCQEDYIRITDLVWDPDARRRDAACVFACRFVMQEDGTWGLGCPLRGLHKIDQIVKDIMDLPNGRAGSEAKRLAFSEGRSLRRRARCYEIRASKSQFFSAVSGALP